MVLKDALPATRMKAQRMTATPIQCSAHQPISHPPDGPARRFSSWRRSSSSSASGSAYAQPEPARSPSPSPEPLKRCYDRQEPSFLETGSGYAMTAHDNGRANGGATALNVAIVQMNSQADKRANIAAAL